MSGAIRRRGEKQEQHGPVRVVFSRSNCPVVDPPTAKGRLASFYRQNPPASERILKTALRVFEPHGIYFQHQALLSGYIGDFYCPQKLLLIELDGPHHSKRRQYDRTRDWHLSRRGIRTVRFDVKRLANMKALLEDIAYCLGLSKDVIPDMPKELLESA